MMPVYNAADFLKETMDSILNQTHTDFEFLIVNDGSTDNSEDIILSYNDSRIRYFKKENGGESSARNYLLQQAKGEFIVFQDADDVSLPNRFELLLQGFHADTIGYVHSDMLLINEHSNPIGYLQSKQVSNKTELIRFFLKRGTPFNNPSMMVRTELLKKFTYDTTIKIGPDTDVTSQFTLLTEGVHINQPLLLYRRHSNNISKQTDYEILFKHVRFYIERHPRSVLFPELDWESDKSASVKSTALVGHFLARRGMTKDAQEYFLQALIQTNTDMELSHFVLGLLKLAQKDFHKALHHFTSITNKDAVVLNYLGETLAFLKDFKEAKKYFLLSFTKNTDYIEPLDNLRAIGGSLGLNLVDNTWMKFH